MKRAARKAPAKRLAAKKTAPRKAVKATSAPTVIDSADVLRAAAALKPPEPPKLTIRQAVDRSERDFLVTLRAKTADDLDIGAVPPHTVPAMTRLLRDLDKEIRAIDARAAEEARESDASPDEEWDAEAL